MHCLYYVSVCWRDFFFLNFKISVSARFGTFFSVDKRANFFLMILWDSEKSAFLSLELATVVSTQPSLEPFRNLMGRLRSMTFRVTRAIKYCAPDLFLLRISSGPKRSTSFPPWPCSASTGSWERPYTHASPYLNGARAESLTKQLKRPAMSKKEIVFVILIGCFALQSFIQSWCVFGGKWRFVLTARELRFFFFLSWNGY